ncbi:hypothetical protein F5X98DRAFT_85802 [Xylaria grammica]|nr:hypothetical protein F5X98DRAFT_85802 [Xylaria grammica]
MPLFKPHHDLLAVGSWADPILEEWSAMRPRRRDSGTHRPDLSAEPHRGSRLGRTESSESSGKDYRNRHPRSEDECLRSPPRDTAKATKKIRATQMTQWQHPECPVKAEGGQQGNKATAKTPGSLSRVEWTSSPTSQHLLLVQWTRSEISKAVLVWTTSRGISGA